jgi:hypothetical protein
MAQGTMQHRLMLFKERTEARHGGSVSAKEFFRHPLLSLAYSRERKAEARLLKEFTEKTPDQLNWALKEAVISARCHLLGNRRLLRMYTIKHALESAVKLPANPEPRYRYLVLLHSLEIGSKPTPVVKPMKAHIGTLWVYSN